MTRQRIISLFFMFASIGLSHNLAHCDFSIEKIAFLNSVIPQDTALRPRVITTVYCDDCSYLAKVEHAGEVFYDNDLNTEYQLMHNGLKILKDCYYGSWMTTLIKHLQGHHEPQEEKIFNEVIKQLPDNAVMLELGSYWGYYSMWLKKEVPHAQVHLIEPDPKNILIGQKNFLLNNIEGIFEQAMVDSKSADNQKFIDWDYNEHTVKAISIDDYASHNNITYIHVLHSDIQGAEIAMLKGCQQLMTEKRIGYYFISTHRGTHEECYRILKQYNLEIIVSITREESFSADGLIVAKIPELPTPTNISVSRRTQEFCNAIERIVNK